jgi:hypothetical protein
LNSHLKIFAVVCAMALLVPAGATAKRPEGKGEKGNKHGALGPKKAKEPKLKLASANMKGVVSANDGTSMTLTVDKASGHAKRCVGQELTFDLTDARFFSADNDADGDVDGMDFRVDDAVKVRTKVLRTKGKKVECGIDGVLPAHAVHNRTTPPVEDETEVEAPEDTEGEEPVVEEPVVEEPVVEEGEEV